ncbi:sporulation membrane protein YtaF [Bacillaceae bacterium Marseille-Q3522]|nr:sporulation membrane protein YtaF [Bacillaceae bacterium Marseille-Q3522]
MAQLGSLLLLAFAVSLDGFSIGLTYGLRKMHLPLKSLLILACCSAITLMSSMAIGHLAEKLISPAAANTAGGVILILIGVWVLFQLLRSEKKHEEDAVSEKTILNLEIKWLGIVIHILRKPLTADFDRSGTITGIEAFFLGFALSLDAFGAGAAAAMLGFSPLPLAAAVAIMSSFFVFSGMKCGGLLANNQWIQRCSFIPGVLLIFIGLSQIKGL